MMSSRTNHRTDAIVLRSLNHGESDLIVTLLTSGYGKLRGIAKGARRSRKRFANALEPYTRLSIIFSTKGADNLSLIEAADIVDHYPDIRSDLQRTLVSSYFMDLVDLFSSDGKLNADLFNLLCAVLDNIDKHGTSDVLVRVFELHLLKFVGYEPVLDRCVICRTPLNDGKLYAFSPAAGGLHCRPCCVEGSDSLPVSLGTIRSLLMGKQMSLDKIHRLTLSVQSARESRDLLSLFIRHILGKEPKSARVINEINELYR